jgi:hypothetical protein
MTTLEKAARAAKQALLDDTALEAWMFADNDPDNFASDGPVRLTPVVIAVLKAIRPRDGEDLPLREIMARKYIDRILNQ